MITRDELLRRRDAIIAVARRHGASNVRIFGSVARGDATETSDLDLIVHFDADSSLMDHGMLIEELQGLLGVNVDVISEAAVAHNDRFARRLTREAIPL